MAFYDPHSVRRLLITGDQASWDGSITSKWSAPSRIVTSYGVDVDCVGGTMSSAEPWIRRTTSGSGVGSAAAGVATGKKLYLQLKSGDSYLWHRKSDNSRQTWPA